MKGEYEVDRHGAGWSSYLASVDERLIRRVSNSQGSLPGVVMCRKPKPVRVFGYVDDNSGVLQVLVAFGHGPYPGGTSDYPRQNSSGLPSPHPIPHHPSTPLLRLSPFIHNVRNPYRSSSLDLRSSDPQIGLNRGKYILRSKSSLSGAAYIRYELKA